MNKITLISILVFLTCHAFSQDNFSADANLRNSKVLIEDVMQAVKKKEKENDKNFNRALQVYTKYEGRNIFKTVLGFSNGIEIICFISRQEAVSIGKINGRVFINFYNNIPADYYDIFRSSPSADHFFQFIRPYRVASY